MEATPSLGSISDDGSYDLSTGPITPDTSPFFRPTETGIIVEKHLTQFLTDGFVAKQELGKPCAAKPQRPLPRRSCGPIRNVCFIGAGYVGGPTAAVLALHNPSLRIEVLDRDEDRIQRWKSAHLPIHEPGLDQVVRVTRDGAARSDPNPMSIDPAQDKASTHSANLAFTTNSKESISSADMIFLAVNTPTKTFGHGAGRATNMNAVDGAVRDIAKHAKDGVIIVEKSTVPCGTARRISSTLRSLRPDMDFEILSNPEFLSEGCAVDNLLRPDRVLIGCSQTLSGRVAASALAALYAAWVPASKIVEVNAWSSELSKLVANAMLAQRISSINSISAICEATGADITEISRSIGLDPRIGSKFLKAGLGFGGSCFRKDIASLIYLAESLGLQDVAEYWHQVNAMNEMQRQRFALKVISQLGENLIGKKLALLGFAFKKDTGDTRESIAVDVIRQLLQERPLEISIFDPYCKEEDILREIDPVVHRTGKGGFGEVMVYEDVYSACLQADAVLIITDCNEFKCEAELQPASKPPANPGAIGEDATFILPNGTLFRLRPRPQCLKGCKDCDRDCSDSNVSQKSVDWARVAAGMREPRRIFDGRCMLNISVMEKLGFQVHSVGRQSS